MNRDDILRKKLEQETERANRNQHVAAILKKRLKEALAVIRRLSPKDYLEFINRSKP